MKQRRSQFMMTLRTAAGVLATRRALVFMIGMLLAPGSSPAVAQELTVQEMNAQKDQWAAWEREERKIVLSARFEGRLGSAMKIEKLEISMRPANGIRFPDSIERGQRLQISGVLEKRTSSFVMIVSRLRVLPDDQSRLNAAIADLPGDDATPWYQLADEYRPLAEYYEDDALLSQIVQVQRDGFAIERRLAAGDSEKLLALADRSGDLGLRDYEQQAVRFEAILALRKTPDHDHGRLLELIKSHCNGWDEVPKDAMADALVEQYRDDPVAFYDAAGTMVRSQLHRRLYRAVELFHLQAELNAGRMTTTEVATRIRSQFPEAAETADEIESGALDRAIAGSASFSRNELLALERRIVEQEREAELPNIVNGWYARLESELADRGVDGRVTLSEHYLFGAAHWKTPAFQQRAILLLKQAFRISQVEQPEFADEILNKLKRLGVNWHNNQWLSDEEMASLPGNDVELAMREGRVVEGMSPDQVRSALGEPSRVTRLVSGSGIRTIWLYQISRIAVHFRSGPDGRQFEEKAKVRLVTEFR